MLCTLLKVASAAQKQEGFGGCAFGEVSLDCHYQSELVVLQEANTGATRQVKVAILAGFVLLFQFCQLVLLRSHEFRFGWGGLAPSLPFLIPVFLIKNVAGSRCS